MRTFAILSFIAITLLLIASASAADIDANDTQTISDDGIASVENDLDALSANANTYSELSTDIGSEGDIKLKHDYDTGSAISITENDGIIAGNETFSIEFYDDYHIYGETNIFGFLMPKDITENVTVEIDSNTYNSSKYDITDTLWPWGGNSQNQTGYMVKFSNLSPGNHQVIIKYPGDAKYLSNTLNKTITINNEIDSQYEIGIAIFSLNPIYPWSWIDDDGDSGPGIDIWFNTPQSEYEPTGNTVIYYNGEIVDAFQGIHDYLINTSVIWKRYAGNGDYYVNVVYSGDEHFKAINETDSFYVAAYECSAYEDSVSVTLPIWASGNLTVKANGKTYTKEVYDHWDFGPHGCERYNIELEGLEIGKNYTLEIKFESDSIYSFTEYRNITYNLKKCPIEVFVMDDNGYYYSSEYISGEYYYGDDDPVIFSVPKDIEKELEVAIDGNTYKYEKLTGDISWYGDQNSDIAFKVDIHNLTVGKHNMTVSYPGDSKYPSNSEKRTLEVIAEIRRNDNFVLSLSLPADAMGNLTVEIENDGEYHLFDTVALNGEKAAIQLPCGNYDLRAHYTGTDYEVKSIEYFEFVLPRYSEMSYGESRVLKVPNNVNTQLVINIGEKGSEMTIAEFSNLNKNTIVIDEKIIDKALNTDMAKEMINKNYNIRKTYYLDLNPIAYTDNGNYELHPIRVYFPNLITGAKDITMQYSDSKTMNLKVRNLYGEPVGKGQIIKIEIGKKTFSAKTDKNGAAKFTIPNTVTPGKYTVKVTYKSAKATSKLTVKQILSLKTATVKKSAKKLVLTATLSKINGKYLKNKAVTFKFNGKTYKTKTNSKGVAKVTVKSSVLKKLKVGKKVTYQATYLKDTVKKTSKVKK